MSEITQGVIVVAIMVVCGVVFGGAVGYATGQQVAHRQAGQIACQSINKTWALIDGQYMCVTVTE